MTLRTYGLHFEGYKKSQQLKDQLMWMQGHYFRMAIASTVGNMFSDKKADKIEYPDKPFTSKHSSSTEEMSEEEKMRETEKLFATLEIMKRNFELDHK